VDISPEAYPHARRNESVAERFFCRHRVVDAYRWLEDPTSNETQAFVTQLNNMSRPFFEQSYSRQRFHSKLTRIFDQKVYGCISKHGPFYYYWYNSGLQNQSILYRQRSLQDGAEGEEMFLDPNKLSKEGTTSLRDVSFSRDGTLMAYIASEKGSDMGTIRVGW